MNTTILFIIIALVCGLSGYFIGLRRGIDTYKHDFDMGYSQGWRDARTDFAAENQKKIAKEIREMDIDEGAKHFIASLDNLFEEETGDEIYDVFDCGEY